MGGIFAVASLVVFAGADHPAGADESLESLIEKLGSADVMERREAAYGLTNERWGGRAARVVPLLRKALADPDTDLRILAATALCSEPAGAAAIAELGALLDDRNPDVREAAAEAWGKIESLTPAAVRPVAAALQSPNPEVRLKAAVLLHFNRDRAAGTVPALVFLLDDRRPERRLQALRTLKAAVSVGGGGPAGPDSTAIACKLLRLAGTDDRETSETAWAALAGMGEAAAPVTGELVELLRDRNPAEVRRWAAITLGKIGPAAARSAAALVEAANSGEPGVRDMVFEALGRIGPAAEAGLPVLRAALKSPDSRTRAAAIRGLADFGAGTDGVVAALAEALTDPSDDVLRAALTGLETFGAGAEPAIPALAKFMRADRSYWGSAAGILSGLGPRAKGAAAELLAVLESGDESRRDCAAEALAAMGPDAAPALPRLRTLAAGEGVKLPSVPAARALWTLEGKAGPLLGPMARVLAGPDAGSAMQAAELLRDMGPAARDAAGALAGALAHKEGWVRVQAADALRSIGSLDRRQVAAVLVRLKSIDNDVRECAVRALGAARRADGKADPEAIGELTAVLRGEQTSAVRSTAAESLGMLGAGARAPAAVAATLAVVALRDADPAVRMAAAEALGVMGPAAAGAAGALRALLEDGDPAVAGAAALSHWRVTGRTEPALAVLMRHLAGRDLDPDSADFAAGALEQMGPAAKPAKAALEKASGSGPDWVRARAVLALRAVNPESAVPVKALARVAETGDLYAAVEAVEKLREIGADAAAAIPTLERIAVRRPPELRRAAAAALAKIRSR